MNSSTTTSCITLLAQADLLLLLSDTFRSPAAARNRLLTIIPADLPELIQSTTLSEELIAPLEHLLEIATQTPLTDWSDEYHRLFEGAMICPANETAFIRRDKGAIIGDLAGYYRAFGWEPTAHEGEKADHLVTELEFLAMLLAMAAAAQGQPADEAADIAGRAIDSFAADHLGDWIEAFCARIEGGTTLPLYRHASECLAMVWRAMAAAHSWPAPAVSASFIESPLDEDPREECGAVDAPVPLKGNRHLA